MMMKEKVGEVFSIAMDNPAIPGCTISKAVHDGANDIICFSLARNTDISAEIYPYHKLIIMAEGVIEIYGAHGFRRNLHTSESIITLTDTPMGIRTAEGAVYTEVSIRRSDIMNEAIKAGEVFRLAEIVPYQDGKIVNMDVVHNDKMKFVMIVFLRLVVVERRDTFHVVPLLELLRELPQHLVGIKLRVFLRQSND